ncbi:MAG TPA: methyltransferase domain-containing protein, partial [Candidatus Krumholzibacteria bacterium]|nr:methyltransferase domain-containing protein [Candidatus Krumholzibacteria bacterium]
MNRRIPDLRRARIYDDLAETYERVSLPVFFAAPGRVLAQRVAPAPGSRILDVGAGTGAVARAVRDRAGDGALVVVADASAAMLRMARGAGLADGIVAMLPDLPFAPESFDIVTSAFVMTHLDDADAAARDMKRVLRAGGRIGLSAWYPADDAAAREWSRIVGEHMDPARVEAAVRETLPGDMRFARAGSLA